MAFVKNKHLERPACVPGYVHLLKLRFFFVVVSCYYKHMYKMKTDLLILSAMWGLKLRHHRQKMSWYWIWKPTLLPSRTNTILQHSDVMANYKYCDVLLIIEQSNVINNYRTHPLTKTNIFYTLSGKYMPLFYLHPFLLHR